MNNRNNLFQRLPLSGPQIRKRAPYHCRLLPNRRPSVANRFSVRQLRQAVQNHHPVRAIAGRRNHAYVNGEGEEYQRIRIQNEKVKMAHIAWRLQHGGKKIPRGYNIHHKDENKKNDRPSNLRLVKAVPHGNKNLGKGR